jgi:hypothetical protein
MLWIGKFASCQSGKAVKLPDSKQCVNMKKQSPLANLPQLDQEIMAHLLRMSPEPQKDAPKPATPKGIAQRQRRRKEREAASAASHDV